MGELSISVLSLYLLYNKSFMVFEYNFCPQILALKLTESILIFESIYKFQVNPILNKQLIESLHFYIDK